MADVYSNVNTEKNVFYSAYLKGKIQYNDVDPDKANLLRIEDEKNDYFAVSGVSDPGVDSGTIKKEENKKNEEQESGKIVVINHDISSNPSSSDNLQKMEKDHV